MGKHLSISHLDVDILHVLQVKVQSSSTSGKVAIELSAIVFYTTPSNS